MIGVTPAHHRQIGLAIGLSLKSPTLDKSPFRPTAHPEDGLTDAVRERGRLGSMLTGWCRPRAASYTGDQADRCGHAINPPRSRRQAAAFDSSLPT